MSRKITSTFSIDIEILEQLEKEVDKRKCKNKSELIVNILTGKDKPLQPKTEKVKK